MTYPGRREPILVAVLVLDGVATAGLAAWVTWNAVTGRWPILFLVVGPCLMAGFLLAAWILLKTTYEIEGSDLIVRQGPGRRRIPVASIDEIFPTNNNPVSPAWAKDRLQVLFVPETKAGTLFLSPADREAFLEALAEADPGLRYDGERVTRGAPT